MSMVPLGNASDGRCHAETLESHLFHLFLERNPPPQRKKGVTPAVGMCKEFTFVLLEFERFVRQKRTTKERCYSLVVRTYLSTNVFACAESDQCTRNTANCNQSAHGGAKDVLCCHSEVRKQMRHEWAGIPVIFVWCQDTNFVMHQASDILACSPYWIEFLLFDKHTWRTTLLGHLLPHRQANSPH